MLRLEAKSYASKQKNPLIRLAKRKCSSYICPACQYASNRRPFGTKSTSELPPRKTGNGALSSYQSPLSSTRRFSTSINTRNPEPAVHESSKDTIEYNFSIQKKPTSPIRESLRLWSSQNEVQKRENAPLNVAAEGRITQLPNSLFIKDAADEPQDNTTQGLDVFDDEDMGDVVTLEPGTLFSHEGAMARQYAVYLGHVGIQAQLMLQSGKWSLERVSNARSFSSGSRLAVIPEFLTIEEVDRIKGCIPNDIISRNTPNGNEKSDVSMQGLPQGPGSEEIVDVFLKKMRKFVTEVNEWDRTYGNDVDAAYEKVAHNVGWRFVSIDDYTRAAGHEYGSLSDSARMALLTRINETDRLNIDTSAKSIFVLCCSKDLEKRILKVVGWSRDYQDAAVQAALGKDVTKMLRTNPLTAFIDKARRIILKSRKLRAPTTIGCLGPTSSTKGGLQRIETGESFTDDDKSIIDFIWNCSFRTPKPLANGSWKMFPITSLILRAVGAYPSLGLEPKVARLFLKELGCADPWTGKSSQDLSLPLVGGRASHRADELYLDLSNLAKEFDAEMAKNNQIPARLDTMAHIRKDWGSLPIVAIDPATAEVIEDAISIEPADEVTGAYWVHVHTSHITSHFDVQSALSRHARHQGTACYIVDGSLPVGMVPKTFTKPFSLQPNAPVLTISTLITEDGRVHDTKVSAGTIREFDQIERGAVNHILGVEESEDDLSVLVVGKVPYVKQPPIPEEAIQKALKYKEMLETIKKLTDARLKRRREEMPLQLRLESPDYGSGLSTTMINYRPGPSREHQSYHWQGDPGIILTGKRKFGYQLSDEKRADDIVTQLMRLAAESAGSWLAKRNIPAVFLGTQATPGNPLSNFLPGADVGQTIAPVFHRSSLPLTYWNINMKAYTLCTSPLRRYMDMLACYQMDSYLKAEASGAIKPGAPIEDESLLALTTSEVQAYVDSDAGSSDSIDKVTRWGKLDYAFQALFRAFHFKESKLPETWEIVITEPFKYSAVGKEIHAIGKLLPFGLEVRVRNCPQGWDKMAGYNQFLPVKIDLVDPDQLLMFVIPVGPPTKTQMLLDPIQAWSESNIMDESDERVDGKQLTVRKI